MKENDRQAKCTRCRNVHLESERVERPRPRRSTASIQMYDRCCPRCGSKEYYDMTPQVAWCWASGLIEIGDRQPADHADGSGAILIASGPKFALRTHLSDLARHGYGHSEGQLLVRVCLKRMINNRRVTRWRFGLLGVVGAGQRGRTVLFCAEGRLIQMASLTPRQLAGRQRRSLRAIRERLLNMAEAWDGLDQFNMGELTDLADRIEQVFGQLTTDDIEGQA